MGSKKTGFGKGDSVNRMCLSKRQYKTPEAAKAAVAIKSQRMGKQYYFYRCPICEQYHTTNRKPKKKRH